MVTKGINDVFMEMYRGISKCFHTSKKVFVCIRNSTEKLLIAETLHCFFTNIWILENYITKISRLNKTKLNVNTFELIVGDIYFLTKWMKSRINSDQNVGFKVLTLARNYYKMVYLKALLVKTPLVGLE